MTFIALIAASLALTLGFIVLGYYFSVRPGGLVENLISRNLSNGDIQKQNIEDLKSSLGTLRVEMTTLRAETEKQVQLLSNRIKSFESMYGKKTKAEEREELREAIFSAARELNQPNSGAVYQPRNPFINNHGG